MAEEDHGDQNLQKRELHHGEMMLKHPWQLMLAQVDTWLASGIVGSLI